jgi:Rad3-related DNA helicase
MASQDEESQAHMTGTKDFHHPYTPYAIQETFMQTVYQVLEEGRVGILESPTGTVSSLQICIESRDPWPR